MDAVAKWFLCGICIQCGIVHIEPKGIEMKKFLKFVLAMVLAFLPGIVGVMFTPNGTSDAWYNALNKSVLTPDGWVFGVAWTILYALLGISLYFVMTSNRMVTYKTRPYALFGVQMALNALWCYLFFGLHMVELAFVTLVALVAVSIWMMRSFHRISRAAAYLVVPYVLWLLFALYLNGTILFIN